MAEATAKADCRTEEPHRQPGSSAAQYPGLSCYPPSEQDRPRQRMERPGEEVLDFPGKDLHLILLGKTGSGKSSTGNTILGEGKFEVGHGLKSKTKTSRWNYATRFGKELEIVDTPGFYDTGMDDDIVTNEIVKAVGCVAPGLHVILFVVRADVRFTAEEAKVVTDMRMLLGDDIMRHVITIFTHGDKFESESQFRDEYLANPESAMGSLLQETNQRVVLFNNEERNPEKSREQVKRLMEVIGDMLEQTGEKPFQTPTLLRFEEIMLYHTDELLKTMDEPTSKDQARRLIRAALMGEQNAKALLHDILDTASREIEQGNEELTKKEEELKKKDDELKKKNDELKKKEEEYAILLEVMVQAAEVSKQGNVELKEKTWCVIL